MKSVTCFGKSPLILRDALYTCEKAILAAVIGYQNFLAGFLIKKTVSKSQYVYNKIMIYNKS